ncbi:MAG: O-antigen ligase family protein [Gammaproteobacteria bacterium]|jgi:O-antigen ligase|nr:O-antigen ligase family protein [Gammaproteobacteria bacterium]
MSPANNKPARRVLDDVGVVGLGMFCFGLRLSTSLASMGLLVCHLAVLFQPRLWRPLLQDPMVRVVLLFAVYLIGLTWWSVERWPVANEEHLRGAEKLFQLWLFLPLAYWFRGDARRIALGLVLAATGFLAMTLYHFDPGRVEHWLAGDRGGFGMAALSFGLYSVVVLLGLFAFAGRLIGRPEHRWFSIPLWLLGIAFFSQATILSLSRATWLAALLVFPPVLWYSLSRMDADARRLSRFAAAAALVILAALVVYHADTLGDRIAKETAVMGSLIDLDPASVPWDPNNSLSVRVHLHRFGFHFLGQRLMTGWGPGGTEFLLATRLPEGVQPFQDLHNSYLELLLRLGVVGTLFFLAGAYFFFRSLWHARRYMPADLSAFTWGGLFLIAIWSFFDFRMLNPDWRFLWLLFGGIGYSFALRERIPDR